MKQVQIQANKQRTQCILHNGHVLWLQMCLAVTRFVLRKQTSIFHQTVFILEF